MPIDQFLNTNIATKSVLCDLCKADNRMVIKDFPLDSHRIVICQQCRLMSAFPPLNPETLDTFYEDTFANDPGCQVRVGAGFPSDKDRKKEEILAETWIIHIIKRYIEPRGKHILDLRCRTGALTSILLQEGADVLGVEPFQGNANYAREVRGLSNIIDLPFSKFHQFPLPKQDYYDVVNVLPHHVLAHVLSPRMLLEQIFKVLRPGGYVFLDEKDVLHPDRHKKESALDTGQAHQFHLTLHTTLDYFRSIGFNIIEGEIDKNRSSDFNHIRIVAQKPKDGTTPPPLSNHNVIGTGQSIQTIQSRLSLIERTWNLRLARIQIKRQWQRRLKKLRI